ncbi:putative Vacuolar protein sorting-associated protein 45 [Blattamonas nauphoetae]|uniref:Vacuolar protein sorting-associated protein 45 n=1 Tax=Blattamonas nauphoetae TaxID=2049346 RepID=A0ABQ9XEX0_9EUKA|nr:putative Vacuolar protein sorting-associated protein 45 [Blattamonas nauphoetae]
MHSTHSTFLIEACRSYILDAIKGDEMKILLVDDASSSIISLVIGQTEILQHNVLLIQRLSDLNRERLPTMQAVAFIFPTSMNIEQLSKELREPLYKDYRIFFIGGVRNEDLDELAGTDAKEVVSHVREDWCNFHAISPTLFTAIPLTLATPESLHVPPIASLIYSIPLHCTKTRVSNDQITTFRNWSASIASSMLSQFLRPTFIRYVGKSPICTQLADHVWDHIDRNDALWKGKQFKPCQLVIFDRREDPVTPLLFNWNYASMLNDVFGLEEQMCLIVKKGKFAPDPDQPPAVFSPVYDSFFAENFDTDLPTLCETIQKFAKEYQTKNKEGRQSNFESVEDMMAYLDTIPEFKRMGSSVQKHFETVEALTQRIGRRNLYDISEVQQHLACIDSHSEAVRLVEGALNDNQNDLNDKLNIVMLYALRYETTQGNRIKEFKSALESEGCENASAVDALLEFAGHEQRSGDLFKTKTALDKFKTKLTQRFKDVKNVLQQHTPLIYDVVEQLLDQKLPSTTFAQKAVRFYQFRTAQGEPEPKNIVIFIVGGATFEESSCFNTMREKGINVFVGGTHMSSNSKFISTVSEYGRLTGRR